MPRTHTLRTGSFHMDRMDSHKDNVSTATGRKSDRHSPFKHTCSKKLRCARGHKLHTARPQLSMPPADPMPPMPPKPPTPPAELMLWGCCTQLPPPRPTPTWPGPSVRCALAFAAAIDDDDGDDASPPLQLASPVVPMFTALCTRDCANGEALQRCSSAQAACAYANATWGLEIMGGPCKMRLARWEASAGKVCERHVRMKAQSKNVQSFGEPCKACLAYWKASVKKDLGKACARASAVAIWRMEMMGGTCKAGLMQQEASAGEMCWKEKRKKSKKHAGNTCLCNHDLGMYD
eukprot:1162068-Pelagomonas_calceolata.AAC.2